MTPLPGPRARALMIQGTGSDVGKSVLVAGLGRALARRGWTVRPFKPQNMSNNAAVTPEGGEIGRAQALQARACGVPPNADMNPVLLKPESDGTAQLVVQGRVRGRIGGRGYQDLKPILLPAVLESFRRLAADTDLVLVEGAGSPAELNLRVGDIANMGFAEAAGVPVVLVGDIDRGGVIASLVGTHAVLTPAERARVRGFVVNRFRGDVSLFDGGTTAITAHTGWPGFGILPHLACVARLPAEDSAGLDRAMTAARRPDGAPALMIAVPRLARIANVDDLDPLRATPGVTVDLVGPGRPLPARADLIVLPGTKATVADLAGLRAEGWDIDILAHRRQGKPVIGICGGYQMLGRTIADPEGIEGPAGTVSGLGLLAVDTVLTPDKRLAAVSGRCPHLDAPVSGYEMHLGVTTGPDTARPFLMLDGDDQGTGTDAGAGSGARPDGASTPDHLVRGSYVHGLFAADRFRAGLLAALGAPAAAVAAAGYESGVEDALDALGAAVAHHLDLDGLVAAAAQPG